MKDQEKQIEEMAKEIFNTCAWRFGKPDDYKEIFNDIAEDLTKLNYRKLPEDSVVLSKKELEELYNDKLTSMYKDAYDTAYDNLRADLEKGKAIVLSENSVVLSKEEYDNYHKLVTELTIENCQTRKELEEKSRYEIKIPNKDFAKKVIKVIEGCCDYQTVTLKERLQDYIDNN